MQAQSYLLIERGWAEHGNYCHDQEYCSLVSCLLTKRFRVDVVPTLGQPLVTSGMIFHRLSIPPHCPTSWPAHNCSSTLCLVLNNSVPDLELAPLASAPHSLTLLEVPPPQSNLCVGAPPCDLPRLGLWEVLEGPLLRIVQP